MTFFTSLWFWTNLKKHVLVIKYFYFVVAIVQPSLHPLDFGVSKM